MSYRLDVAADALADLRQLEAVVQEAVLDEIDRIVAIEDLAEGEHVFRFRDPHAGHYLIMNVIINRASNVLTVIGIGEEA